MKPLAALLLVALVGAGWAESHGDVYWCERCQKWYQRQEGMWAYGCGVIHQPGDCCHYGEQEMAVSVLTDEGTGCGSLVTGGIPFQETIYNDPGGAGGITDWHGDIKPLTPEAAMAYECDQASTEAVHDWQQVYRVQTYIGYPYVDLQSCSRCGILRVKP